MPSATKQELHLAKSLDELKKRSEIPKFGKTNIERIIEFANKFYREAINHQHKGDSERAYLFYYRFSTLLSYIHNENDKQKFLLAVGNKAKEVLEQMQFLSDELSERYAEKQKSYEDRKAQLFKQPISIPGNAVKIDPIDDNIHMDDDDDDDDDDECYRSIDCKQLIQHIQSMSEINKILIIDIRLVEQFSESSIAANKLTTNGEINIINIPENLIQAGLTLSQLKKKISFGIVQDGIERRRSMDMVIIVDDKTNEFDKKFKCCLLADAFWKWDQSPDKIKNKPLLLKGGYRDFILTYPMYTTNPNSITNYDQTSLSSFDKPKPQLNFYNFYDEDNNDNNKPTSTSSSSIIINNGPSSIMSPTLNENNNDKSIKIPGIARPIIPDRSSKPIREKLPLNDSTNQTIIKSVISEKSDMKINSNNQLPIANNRTNLPPKPAHLLTSLQNGTTTTTTKTNGILGNNQGDKQIFDNDDADGFTVGKLNDSDMMIETKSNVREQNIEVFPMDEEMSDYENNHQNHNQNDSDSDNESITNSISKPIEMNNINNNNNNNKNDHHNNQPFSSGSLSRSLSSPNIAQFEQNFQYNDTTSPLTNSISPKFSTQTPLVDRSAKPSFANNLSRKTRDFSPQFSSCARIAGLRNLGNTCFMNAIIQCLKNTKEFYEFLIAGNVHINPNSKFGSNGELTVELIELFRQMRYPSNFKHISPKDFKCAVSRHIPDFIDYKQQDAHEFLVRLLDRLHADLNRSKPDNQINDPISKDPNFYDKLSIADAAKTFWSLHIRRNNSFISDIFEGLIVSTLTCLHCQTSSKSLEAFTCLTLPIPENVGRTTLQNCINLFVRGELLSNEVAWQCQSCRQKRNAQKCTYIWRLPRILIIHLKRFTYDGMWRQKISTFVDFPIEHLKIETANNEIRLFSLYGVVNHFGSLEGGHYVAYSRNRELNIDWHRYDDQDVSPMSSGDVVTQNAYVLFYRSV